MYEISWTCDSSVAAKAPSSSIISEKEARSRAVGTDSALDEHCAVDDVIAATLSEASACAKAAVFVRLCQQG